MSHGLTEELSQQATVFQQVLAPDVMNSLNNESADTGNSSGRFTLYEFLVELFGERLLLMLETRKRCSKAQQISPNHVKRSDSFPTAAEFFGPNLQTCIDEAFRRHQMREGFVSLHHLVSSQRLVTMKKPLPTMSMNFNPFCVRMYRLPIIHNVLDLASSPMRSFRQGNQSIGRLRKGKLSKGNRRNLLNWCCTTGVGTYWL